MNDEQNIYHEEFSSLNWVREYTDSANAEKFTYKTLPTGFAELDEVTGGGIQEGITLLIAETAKGKTFFTTQVILNALESDPDADAIIFSLEISRKKILDRLVSQVSYKLNKESKLDQTSLQGYLNGLLKEDEEKAVKSSLAELERNYLPRLQILDRFTDDQVYDFKKHNVEEIKAIIEHHAKAYPDKKHIVAIDYFHLITKPTNVFDERRQLNEIMDELAKLAIKYHIIFFIVAIENRKSTDKNTKDYLQDVDHLNLIKGSGELEHYAYQAILLKDGAISLIKSRDGEPKIDMKMSHIRPTGTFISGKAINGTSTTSNQGFEEDESEFEDDEPEDWNDIVV